MRNIIRHSARNSGHGFKIATQERMSKSISLIKEYPRPEFTTKPRTEDIERTNRVELAFLQGEIKRLRDKIRRLEREIVNEIRMLTAVLDKERKETYDQIKRRVSRLKGSIEYIGREDSIDETKRQIEEER